MSSTNFFLLNKQRFVLIFGVSILHFSFLRVSLLRPPAKYAVNGFMATTIMTHRMKLSDRFNLDVSRSGNQEGIEDGDDRDHLSTDGNGIDNDDNVQALPVTRRISLPRQLPNDILNSIEEQQRRERERLLIAKIQEGDKAILELRQLWSLQSGNCREEELLNQAAKGIGDPRSWQESKEILERLTIQNPTFLEPFARLSKLYCLMGRLEDSQIMALEVLKLKPWHFIAIETMVATSYALSKIQTSLYWASRRMPPPSQTAKRREWIQRAIESSLEFEDKLLSTQGNEEQEIGDVDNDGNDEHLFRSKHDAWQ